MQPLEATRPKGALGLRNLNPRGINILNGNVGVHSCEANLIKTLADCCVQDYDFRVLHEVPTRSILARLHKNESGTRKLVAPEIFPKRVVM